jgi:hypothetical protein
MEDYWPPVSFADTLHATSNKNITMAIVIAPDYDTPIPGNCNKEYRSHIHQYLTDAGIFQKSLSSAQKHVMELKDVLTRRGINLTSIQSVEHATVQNAVEVIQCRARECISGTLFLYFCGHGISTAVTPENTDHGLLLLRGVEKLTSEHIDAALRSANFSGTLIKVLNTCHAGRPDPIASNASLVMSSLKKEEGFTVPYQMIRLTSSAWEDSQPSQQGIDAGKEIIKLIKENLPVHQWEESLKHFKVHVDPVVSVEHRVF